MPATVIERRIGETGNPLHGTLANEDGTLTIPADATVSITVTNPATGATLIDNASATIVDRAAREVSYAWADDDLATAGEFDVVWAINTVDEKQTFVPDARAKRIRLIVW